MSSKVEFDPSEIYDNPPGEIPAVPIGQCSHIDGNGVKKADAEIAEIKALANEVGAEITTRPNGFHDTTVIRHKAWIWGGAALGAGITALGVATAFALEHHKRKHKK